MNTGADGTGVSGNVPTSSTNTFARLPSAAAITASSVTCDPPDAFMHIGSAFMRITSFAGRTPVTRTCPCSTPRAVTIATASLSRLSDFRQDEAATPRASTQAIDTSFIRLLEVQQQSPRRGPLPQAPEKSAEIRVRTSDQPRKNPRRWGTVPMGSHVPSRFFGQIERLLRDMRWYAIGNADCYEQDPCQRVAVQLPLDPSRIGHRAAGSSLRNLHAPTTRSSGRVRDGM